MKKASFVLLFFVISVALHAQSNTVVLKGLYQGKNIYVQNPYAVNGVDYCASEVWVNGVKQDINLEQSAFEIDLSYLALQDSILIQILHKEGCKPKVLNSLIPKVNIDFSYTHLRVLNDSCLSWGVTGKPKQKIFYVERIEYNTWKAVDTLFVEETSTDSSWTRPVELFSGMNQFRIKCMLKSGQVIYSPVYEYVSVVPKTKVKNDKQNRVLYLTQERYYMLHSETGDLILQGRGTSIPYGTINKGKVYLSYDNQTATLKLK